MFSWFLDCVPAFSSRRHAKANDSQNGGLVPPVLSPPSRTTITANPEYSPSLQYTPIPPSRPRTSHGISLPRARLRAKSNGTIRGHIGPPTNFVRGDGFNFPGQERPKTAPHPARNSSLGPLPAFTPIDRAWLSRRYSPQLATIPASPYIPQDTQQRTYNIPRKPLPGKASMETLRAEAPEPTSNDDQKQEAIATAMRAASTVQVEFPVHRQLRRSHSCHSLRRESLLSSQERSGLSSRISMCTVDILSAFPLVPRSSPATASDPVMNNSQEAETEVAIESTIQDVSEENSHDIPTTLPALDGIDEQDEIRPPVPLKIKGSTSPALSTSSSPSNKSVSQEVSIPQPERVRRGSADSACPSFANSTRTVSDITFAEQDYHEGNLSSGLAARNGHDARECVGDSKEGLRFSFKLHNAGGERLPEDSKDEHMIVEHDEERDVAHIIPDGVQWGIAC